MTDSLLKKMEKRHQFVHNIQALKLSNQYNLEIDGLNIIRGILTETKEDILESCSNLKFLRFLLNRYNLRPRFLELYKGSPLYEEIPEEERKSWRYHQFWEEIAPLDWLPDGDQFEFFGFYSQKPTVEYKTNKKYIGSISFQPIILLIAIMSSRQMTPQLVVRNLKRRAQEPLTAHFGGVPVFGCSHCHVTRVTWKLS